ncbi:hypothetical protein Dimus_035901 [Dionaea muscipula]
MGKKSRKKKGKSLEPWECPGIVSGLSAEYTFSDEEDIVDACSLPTIDEDEDENDLDEISNPSYDEEGEETEHTHPQETLQMILLPDTLISGEGQQFDTQSENTPRLDEGTSSNSHQVQEDPSLLLEIHSTKSTFGLEAQSRITLQPQMEIGQSSKEIRDGLILPDLEVLPSSIPHGQPDLDSNCRRGLKKVWMPKSQVNASKTQVPQDEQGNANIAGSHTDIQREGDQTVYIQEDDQDIHYSATQDIPLETVVSRSENEDNQKVEDDCICSPRQSPPCMINTDASKQISTLDPEGFQQVRKKGRKKSRKLIKDHMEHHQDRPDSVRSRRTH